METREYKLLNSHYPKILNCIEVAPYAVADQLKPSCLLPSSVLEFVRNPNRQRGEKARELLDAVMVQVQINPQVVYTFINALKALGNSGINGTVKKLEEDLLVDEAGCASMQSVLHIWKTGHPMDGIPDVYNLYDDQHKPSSDKDAGAVSIILFYICD